MKKKRENMIGVIVIYVSLCSHPIDVVLGAETVFEELF